MLKGSGNHLVDIHEADYRFHYEDSCLACEDGRVTHVSQWIEQARDTKFLSKHPLKEALRRYREILISGSTDCLYCK